MKRMNPYRRARRALRGLVYLIPVLAILAALAAAVSSAWTFIGPWALLLPPGFVVLLAAMFVLFAAVNEAAYRVAGWWKKRERDWDAGLRDERAADAEA